MVPNSSNAQPGTVANPGNPRPHKIALRLVTERPFCISEPTLSKVTSVMLCGCPCRAVEWSQKTSPYLFQGRTLYSL